MRTRFHRSSLLVVAGTLFTLSLGACDSLTSPEASGLEVRLRTDASTTTASALLSDGLASFAMDESGILGNGPVDLEDVQSISVEITDVQVLPVGEESGNGAGAGGWISLDGIPSDNMELLDLGSYTNLGTLPDGSGVSEIVAIRIVFGSSSITVADETSELFIPSGKVTIATPGLATGETTVDLEFMAEASVHQVILTGAGYLMPPVIRVAGDSGPDAEE